ncbi:MAG TPA: hypothetical protein VKA68_03030 [bacterium]|nr:hypothetical protein [bacterium]
MSKEAYTTTDENALQQKELELVQEGYQNTANERLSPGGLVHSKETALVSHPEAIHYRE